MRSIRWTGMLVLPAMLLSNACASTRPPVARLAASPTVEPCGAVVKGVDVRGWRQIEAEGFTFCAPASWSRNVRFDRRRAQQTPGIARVSWAAPDTLHRVVISVLVEERAIKRAAAAFERCQQSKEYAARFGEQDACVYRSSDNTNPPDCPNAFVDANRTDPRWPVRDAAICIAGVARDWGRETVTIIYGKPLVNVTAYGNEDALAVARTVRPVGVSGAGRE
ncbi:MAG: hypothetical protein LCH84_01195 [Gemmatimonadetes bacterium]|nr:hypothetical protein [Gemmatimonadota bacterium]